MVGVLPHRRPLQGKLVLHELPCALLRRVSLLRREVEPRRAVIGGLQRHEVAELGNFGIPIDECRDLPLHEGIGKRALCRETEQGNARFVQLFKVAEPRALLQLGKDLVLREIALADESIGVDQKGVAAERRVGAVGRAVAVGHTEGEGLPEREPALLQTVDEVKRFYAERSRAVFAGERGDVHQNTAFSLHDLIPFADFRETDTRGSPRC